MIAQKKNVNGQEKILLHNHQIKWNYIMYRICTENKIVYIFSYVILLFHKSVLKSFKIGFLISSLEEFNPLNEGQIIIMC